MPGKRRPAAGDFTPVFLNVPYSPSYERMLVALTAALVAVRAMPRLTFQVPDGGEGRLKRIYGLLRSCRVSIHDLSSVGMPVRFNMPFELGMAYAIKAQSNRHDFLVLEKKAYRLDRHLSDLCGVDPKIHNGTARGAICAVLEVLERPGGNPPASEVMRLHRRMMTRVPTLKALHGNRDLFSTRVYGELVTLGREWAQAMNL